MKQFLLFCFLLNFSVIVLGQSIIENVNFDNYASSTNNDFVHNFTGGLGLSQTQNNGITGGCLTTPNSISWGNDNAIYCSRYRSEIGSIATTSICFKYNSSLVNPNGYERAASIHLNPFVDGNHYIVVTVQKNKTLGILSYGWNNNYGTSLNLLDNRWYKLQVKTTTVGGSFGDRIDILAEVFDLGANGTNSPSIVNFATGTIYDITYAKDTAIRVSFTGARWGGSEYLDNFTFSGIKSSVRSCSNSLPLTLLSFEADKKSNEVLLRWETTNEHNVKSYIIESSFNGYTFNVIHEEASINLLSKTTYTFIDKNIQTGKIYYKLKMLDKDGQYSYSKVVAVEFKSNGFLNLSPTVVTNSLKVFYSEAKHGAVLNITTLEGRVIKSQKLNYATTFIDIDCNLLGTGVYFITVANDGKLLTKKFIKD